MARIPKHSKDDAEDPSDRGRGLYDPDPDAGEDPWFLPAPPEEPAWEMPGPKAARQPLFDPAAWRAAQDAASGDLAALAFAFGTLDARLRAGPEGLAGRLALLEAADLGWWSGARFGTDRLALWLGLRAGAAADDAAELARLGWAARRLTRRPGPDAAAGEGRAAALAAFLGREAAAGVPEAVAELAGVLEDLAGLHPVTRAAAAFAAWRMLGPGPAAVEAAVLAARIGAGMGQGEAPGGAPFLPLALGGGAALRAGGGPGMLGPWIAGAVRAVRAALLELDRIGFWQARAEAATADLTGRTPPALVAALAAWPALSAPMAERLTGASRAAVQRNLDTLAARGLVREITGQGRYRMWAAKG